MTKLRKLLHLDEVPAKPLYDLLDSHCPNCKGTLNSNPSQHGTLEQIECETCHLRIRITTRNNDRMSQAYIAGTFLALFALVLGGLIA